MGYFNIAFSLYVQIRNREPFLEKEAIMAIHSNTFGGLRLSGEDAVKFRNQVRYGRPSKAAKETASRGRQMAEEFARDGFVVVDIATK